MPQGERLNHNAPARPAMDSVQLARREFLRACGLLVTALAGCRTLGANLRLGADLADAPHPDRTAVITRALITTLLPCEDPAFPLAVRDVEARLVEYFEPYADPDLDSLRRALVVFDDIGLFPERLALFTDDERERLVARGHASADAVDAAVERALAHDAAAFAAFRRGGDGDRFSTLPLAEARAYVRLWSHSGFGLRCQFYRSTKTLVMLSAYSLPAMWHAIGYEGPLLERS